jgi:hypothetical protein
VEGKVTQLTGTCPALILSVDEQSVHTTSATSFAGDPCSKIKKNTRVSVRGVRQPAGWILASRVEQNTHGDEQ